MDPAWHHQSLEILQSRNLLTAYFFAGSQRNDLVAKVFGGAAVLNSSDCIFNIGERNIDIQENLLQENEIRVVAKSLGGDRGRKLIFNTNTGLVKMKYVKKSIIL